MEAAADPACAALADLVARLPDDLRKQALTHSSWTDDRLGSYERLAFIGDSVLGLSVAAEVFARFAEVDSGRLTKIHNQAVSSVACSEVGEALAVPDLLRDAQPTENFNGIPAETLLEGGRPLPEVTEALIGAVFLAFGFETAASAVAAAFAPRIELVSETRIDFKSALQELLARSGDKVVYDVVGEDGPPHERTFEVAAMVGDREIGRGSGRSKKAAEQVAAEAALERLDG
jgi:ribonuclease-3